MNKSPQILAEQYTIATETSNFIYGGKSNTFFHIFSGKITQNQLYACDSKSECKKLIKTFGTKPPTREHHTCVLYNNEIFVFGGYSENNQCTDIYALDLRTKKWRSLKSTFFKTSLYHHTSIVYEGSMFVFGGISGNSVSNSLYKYTFSTNQWEVVVTNQNDVFLPSSRFKHSSFIHDECLYILGGRNFVNYCSDMFCFHLKTKKWRKILFSGSFPNEVTCSSPLIFENSIIEYKFQNSIFEYHLTNKVWKEKSLEIKI